MLRYNGILFGSSTAHTRRNQSIKKAPKKNPNAPRRNWGLEITSATLAVGLWLGCRNPEVSQSKTNKTDPTKAPVVIAMAIGWPSLSINGSSIRGLFGRRNGANYSKKKTTDY